MGFFNILETVFFISLAITFFLIMMLVYHFKTRLINLEQKCDTMFDIMNNMIKEMKNINGRINTPLQLPSESIPLQMPSQGGFPIELLSSLFNGNMNKINEEDDEDDEDDVEGDIKKIVVSDAELENDDTEIKVIHVELNEQSIDSDSLPDLEEINTFDETVEINMNENKDESIVVEETDDVDEDDDVDDDINEHVQQDDTLEKVDYKKMDISYLRTMVITRGLATTTKGLKKNDLINLLSN